MKFETKKEHLSEAIKKVIPFTGKLNEFTNIKFVIEGQILKLVAQSEIASSTYKLNIVANDDFEFSVNGSEINNIIDTFKNEITISKERELITISEGKTKLKLMSSTNNLPIQKINSENEIEIDYKTFKSGLIKTYEFCEGSQQTGVLTGVLVALEEDKINFTGMTQNFLSYCSYSKELNVNHKFILPASVIRELIKINSDFVKISWTNSRVKFDFGYTEIITNLINGTFPKFEVFLNYKTKDTLELKKEDLLLALKKAQLLATKENFVLKFELDTNKIKLSFIGKSKTLDDYIACKYTGEKRLIKLNCELLSIVIRNCEDDIKICFSETNKMALYFENENNLILLMTCT